MRIPLLFAILLLLATGPVAAQTPAGSVVRSQAVATVDGERYLSNVVDTVVQAVCGVSVAPNGSTTAPAHRLSVLPDGPAYLPYVISNTGNVRQAYPLGVQHDLASDWTATGHAFYLDTNRNGRIDPHEEPATSVTLDPGVTQHLVLELATPSAGSGTSFVSPVAACPGGTADTDNTAVLALGAPDALELEKHATPAPVAVGETLRFRLDVTNPGASTTSGPVVITDLLNTPALEGVTFEPGSARTTLGLIEYFDGISWSSAEPARVQGLRVRAPDLDRDRGIRIDFGAVVAPDAVPGMRTNTVTASTPGGTSSVQYLFEVLPVRDHALGPAGNPAALPGGEGTNDDQQHMPPLIENQPACIDVTLRNAGNSADRYRLAVDGLPSGVHAEFRTTVGTPLYAPVMLRSNESITFRLCMTPSIAYAAPFDLGLLATADLQGGTNGTRLRIGGVQAAATVELDLTATPTGVLASGQLLTYELRVTNTSDDDLTNARLTIPFPAFTSEDAPALTFEGASESGSYDPAARTVTWSLPALGADDSVTRTLTVRAPTGEPSGSIYTLQNAFAFRSDEITNPLISDTVTHTYPGYELLASLGIAPTEVRLGGQAQFTFILTNPTRYPVTLDVRNTLPHGVAYQPGTTRIRVGSNHVDMDPHMNADELAWDLTSAGSVTLGPAGTSSDQLTLTYTGVITPQARTPLQAAGWATGTASTDAGPIHLGSNRAAARADLAADAFTTPEGLLTGRVFLDRDHDEAFDPAVDLPLESARVILSNGWQAATDTEGLYAFRDLVHGPWLVLLDPSSAPFPAPAGNRQHVDVHGVHVLDFPLLAPTGAASTQRSTTLAYGPVTLTKLLSSHPDRTIVTLELRSDEPLEDVTVRDPLPDGGSEEFHLDLLESEHVFTYNLPPGAPLTDPDVRWKDPYP